MIYLMHHMLHALVPKRRECCAWHQHVEIGGLGPGFGWHDWFRASRWSVDVLDVLLLALRSAVFSG